MTWEKVKLVDISSPKQWKTISTDMLTSDGYPVYGANGIIGKYKDYTHEIPTVLITCRGATCGNIHISQPFSYINGNAMALDKLSSKVSLRYLYYFLLSYDFSNVISGSAQPQITIQGLQKVEVPLPPLHIQEQIADTLDKADALRRKDQELLHKYDELAQSIFYDMFGDPVRNEKGWGSRKLKDICLQITDGTHFSPPSVESGIPYITAKHLKKWGLDFFNNPTYVDEAHHKEIYARCKPQRGDVLYIKDGATTGLAAINEYDFEFSMLSSLALIKPDSRILNNVFLKYWLNNERVKAQLVNEFMAGAAIQRFTLSKINQFVVNLPPLHMQELFSKKLTALDQLQRSHIAVKGNAETLFNTIITKSFVV
jgi:type I restriction enzyme S subunit